MTFADCDVAGIMFYPRTFEMVNRVVEAWFAGPLKCSFRVLHQERHLSVPTARFEVDFKGANRLEEVLDCTLTVARIGKSSCDLRIVLMCEGELRVHVKQTLVMVDGEALKSCDWPEDLRQAMTPFLSAG